MSECLFGTGLGADIKIEGEAVCELFSEMQSRYVLSVKPEHRSLFETIVTDAVCVGRVVDEPLLTIRSAENESILQAQVSELEQAWKGAIPCLLK